MLFGQAPLCTLALDRRVGNTGPLDGYAGGRFAQSSGDPFLFDLGERA